MDAKFAVEQSLNTFIGKLSEKPKWVLALSYTGRFIGRFGEYEDESERRAREATIKAFGNQIQDTEARFTPLDDNKAAEITYEYALATMKLMDGLKSERSTLTIATGDGSYVIWFTFRYIIGINYSNFGIRSTDQTLDSIYHSIQELHDSIWSIDGYHSDE